MGRFTSTTENVVDDYPPHVLESLQRQARRYAEQIRLLEADGLMEDRLRIRKAWKAFVGQHADSGDLWWFTRTAYTKAYLNPLT